MENVISINNLKKSYKEVIAINGISLGIKQGEMFGLVGPDGAGKTTTIRICCGLTNADEGEVKIFGRNILEHRKEIRNEIGYLSQKFSLYGDLSVDENIEFFAEIHQVKDFHSRRDELLQFTRLTPFRKRLADQLSGGMKQTLALACSLIHKPKI
ncbi:MAG: ABC transporter ATP-binding protein, partial [Ignavibacterium sp.]